jgi:alcohol dehydrogenase
MVDRPSFGGIFEKWRIADGAVLLGVLGARKFDAKQLITHRFPLDRILDAYDTFTKAASSGPLKVIIEA